MTEALRLFRSDLARWLNLPNLLLLPPPASWLVWSQAENRFQERGSSEIKSTGEDPQTAAQSMEQAKDETDIRDTLSGDDAAFERIVRRYQQQIGSYLWRFTRDVHEHEDLVHVVFVEAYISLPKFKGVGSFSGWLLTIATRMGYAFWKRQAKLRRRGNVSLEFAPEPASAAQPAALADDPQYEQLAMALASLPPRDRLVLTLMYLEEQSVAEISELTGWSKSMVKVQAHRARNKLKAILGEDDG